MSKPAAHERDEMILELLDGNLPEQEQVELRAWLDASPAHWERYAELSFIHSQIADQLNSQRSADDVRLDAVQSVPEFDPLPPIHIDTDALTKEKYLSALAYIVEHTFTPKRVAILAAAAVLLLGAVLTIVMMTGSEPTPDIALTPDEQIVAPTPSASIVATLTAEREAQWASDAPTTGDALAAGQRLILTQGFAEITTARGAVAILEAPATIELLNNDNALRLHTGKLVGICETPSSKGFLVRTPHMDITDLGTRFGVDASTTDATEVHVFEGEVEARRPNATGDTEPIRLVANQSIRTTADAIASIELDTDHFATRLPSTLSLAGTGAGIRLNTADPNWQITEIDGRPLDTPQAVIARTYTHELYQRVPNDPAVSQWLGWSPPSGDSQEQTYTFRTQVTLPDGINPDSAEIHLRYAADNELRAIRVNGQTLAVNNPAQLEQVDFYPFAIRDHLVAGPNTIEFVVANLELNDNPAGLVGLNVRWEIKDRTP